MLQYKILIWGVCILLRVWYRMIRVVIRLRNVNIVWWYIIYISYEIYSNYHSPSSEPYRVYVSLLSRPCGVFNISKPYRPPRSLTAIVLPFLYTSRLPGVARVFIYPNLLSDRKRNEFWACKRTNSTATTTTQPKQIKKELDSRPTRRLMRNYFWIILFTLYWIRAN
jgi:hypothetical protein